MKFLVTTKNLQRNTLAPLFITVLEFVLKKTEITTTLQTHSAKLSPDLDLDQDETEAIEHFQTIEFSARKVCLNINYNTTKIMINIDNPKKEVIEGKLVMKIAEYTVLVEADDFKYPVAYIVNCHVDFKRCRGLAWSQFWKLETIWKSKGISLSLK